MNGQLKIITFLIGEQYYGLPLDSVMTVLRAVEITPLPNISHFMLGIINLHGKITPVINLRKLIGLETKKIHLSDRLIVTELYARPVIIVADSIETVIKYFPNEITPVDYCASINSQHVKGVLNKNNHLVFILNLEKLLSDNDIQWLNALTEDRSETT